MFWHWMWLECKKPNAGAVYDCMRHTRRAYHSAIRRTRQIEKDIRKEKVAEHCHEKSAKNFWQCIKRINRNLLVGSIYRVRSIMKLILSK